MSNIQTYHQQIITDIQHNLGGGMIDVELTPEDYESAIRQTIERYKQISSGAYVKDLIHIELEENVQRYTLDTDIMLVENLYRRSYGGTLGSNQDAGTNPYDIAFVNHFFPNRHGYGDLLTHDLFYQFTEQAGKQLGAHISFQYDSRSKMLLLETLPRGNETILASVLRVPTDEFILSSHLTFPWVKRYALALCKIMLGGAYRKYPNIPGANTPLILPGDQLIAEAREDIITLEEEARLYAAGDDDVLEPIIG